MEKILVTGGAGFIGSNFIYYMLRHHDDVSIVCFDKLTYAGCLRNLKPLLLNRDPNFRFIKGDITDAETVNMLFRREQFDMVVNFAAQSHVDRSITDPAEFQHTNVLGTQVLLDAFNQYGISRFHQVSTDEVYGSIAVDDEETAFDESAALNPGNPYAASKASADLLCMSYFNTYGTPVTISRCCNNYGPRQFPEKLVAKTIVSAELGKKIPIYGDGENVRTWLYVDDHCRAIDAILHGGKIGEIYNVDGTDAYSNLDLVKDILDRMDADPDLYTFVEDRAGHDKRYSLDDSKLCDSLDWEPKYEMEEGLDRTIDWYRRHENWWKAILDGSYREDEHRLLGSGE